MKTLLLLASLAFASLLSSCSAPAHAASAPSSAISCAKCGTVYFKSPSVSSAPGDKGFVTLKSSSKMSCPTCENKVVAWAKGDTFVNHVCKTCGGAMKHCSNH
jgi:ribosomal protein S27E